MVKEPKIRVGPTPDRVEDIHKKKIDSPIEDELIDDTMYGEIIPSLMGWSSSEFQKERNQNLEEVAKELSIKAAKRKKLKKK